MRFIEILTDFNHDGLQFYKGEVVKVDDNEAEYFCKASWAKDPTGEFETGEPNAAEVRLQINNGNHVTEGERNG